MQLQTVGEYATILLDILVFDASVRKMMLAVSKALSMQPGSSGTHKSMKDGEYMKKILALLLALCLCLGLMAGCGSQTGSAGTAASSAAGDEASVEAPADEADEDSAEPADEADEDEDLGEEETSEEEAAPVGEGEITAYAAEVFGTDEVPAEISYPLDTDESLELMATFPDPLFASYPNGMADLIIYQAAEEKTGVHMEYTPLSTSASNEQFNVIMASGSYPDLVGWGLNYTGGDDTAVEQDIYLDLKEYIAEYAPNYFKILGSDDELLDNVLTNDGNITGFNVIRREESPAEAGMVIRTDLLEKLGLDKPYTIEEYENVLAAFKEEGLEQPLVMLGAGAIQGNWLGAAFDVNCFCNSFPMTVVPSYVKDGEIKFGPIEDGFLEYITLMHDWYEKGYIDRDFVSINSNWNSPDYSNAITTGQAGIFYTDWGNIGGLIEQSEVPGFDLEGTYDMHATKDSINHFATKRAKGASDGFHITSSCENVELACQWGDWWFTDEGSLIANYGIEGTSYEMVDGKPKFTEAVTNPENVSKRDALLVYASNGTICCIKDPDAVASMYSDVDNEARDIWAEGMDDAYVIPDSVTLTADETTEANNIYSDIGTLCMEYITAFITGDKSLDDYQEFKSKIEAMNIEGYLDIYQAAYDRAMGN